MSALPGLTRVQCRVSAVIGASVETTWDILRVWTNLSDFFGAVDGHELHTNLVVSYGVSSSCIGACPLWDYMLAALTRLVQKELQC